MGGRDRPRRSLSGSRTHGGSGSQARAVIEGLDADVVRLLWRRISTYSPHGDCRQGIGRLACRTIPRPIRPRSCSWCGRRSEEDPRCRRRVPAILVHAGGPGDRSQAPLPAAFAGGRGASRGPLSSNRSHDHRRSHFRRLDGGAKEALRFGWNLRSDFYIRPLMR